MILLIFPLISGSNNDLLLMLTVASSNHVEYNLLVRGNPTQHMSRRKDHRFSPKFTRVIRTPFNTDKDKFLCPESQTLICRQPRFTDTGYVHTLYFHRHNYVLIVDMVPCSNNDRFLRVITNFLLTKQKENSLHENFDFDQFVFLPVFDPCAVVL